MKAKTTLRHLLFLSLFLVTETQAQVTIFNADFSNALGNNAFTGSGWSIGTANYPASGSGNYLFLNQSGSTYTNNLNTFAITPTINLTNYERLTLSLRFYYNTQSGVDGFRILFSTDNGTTYFPLGKENDQATNWYTITNVTALGTNFRGWSGNPHGTNWVAASIDLPSQGFDNKNNIRFRIEFRSNGSIVSTGVAIDDFKVIGYTTTTKTYLNNNVFNKLEVWYKPETLSALANDAPIDTWTNSAAINTDWTNAVGTGTSRPLYKNNTTSNVNFNPVVNFDGTKSMFTRQGFYNHDIFIVVNPGTPVSSAYAAQDVLMGDDFLEIAGTQDITGLSINNTSARYGAGVQNIAAYNQGAQTNYGIAITSSTITYDRPVIFNARLNAAGTGMNLYLDGVDLGVTLSPTLMKEVNSGTFKQILNSRFWIGRSEYFIPSFNGDVLEIMMFSERKSDSDRKKIESYLAIKYGINPGLFPMPAISLPHVPGELVDSDGVALWNTTISNGYTYNVGAIGRDDATGLNQKQSKSIDPESFLTVGLRDIYTTNALNTNTFVNNKDYLVWGSNLLPLTEMASPIQVNLGNSLVTTSTRVTNRTWKFVERATTDVGNVKISLPTSSVSSLPALSGNSDYVLILADDSNFTTNVETVFLKAVSTNLEATYNFNGTKYMKLGVAEEVIASRHIKFDGTNDFIRCNDVTSVTAAFSISAWVNCEGSNTLNNDKTIVAKKGATQTGYHFLINNANKLVMRFHNGVTMSEIVSNTTLSTNQWRNVAFTLDGANVGRLYIDGVLDIQSNMNARTDMTNVLTIGGRYVDESSTVDFFKGKLEEIHIWNAALTVDEIRFMMNQEIEKGSGVAIRGKIIPASVTKNDISTRTWDNSLFAYFNMNHYIGTNLNEASGKKFRGSMNNTSFYTVEEQSAPIPYVSAADGAWETSGAWANGGAMYYPNNSLTINGVVTKIDWNIIKTTHNITSSGNKTVLAAVIDNNTLRIDNDSKLEVTHHLKINGKIDLVGKSQLIQTNNSDSDPSGTGTLERDQQGTGNKYNYNYWSSPVSTVTSTVANNTGFTLNNALKDGTNPAAPAAITWTSALDGSSSPLSISLRWLHRYVNSSPAYANWELVNQNTVIQTGHGITMKGTGIATAPNIVTQNYVFTGKPNNGTINHSGLTVGPNNLNLIGNPYPSALDASKFIDDNISAITGALYFWEHFPTNNSHIYAAYQGGYATYTKTGSVAPVPPAQISGLGSSSRTPKQFIPVGQAFFIRGNATGGSVTFNNGQRLFVKEDDVNSNILFRNQTQSIAYDNSNDLYSIENYTKIALKFTSLTTNFHREILLGFMNENANNEFNYGYDGELMGLQDSDVYFQLDAKKLVIQGVGHFNTNLAYPLTIKSNVNNNNVRITIERLENYDDANPIYIHDGLHDTYHNLLINDFQATLPAGELTGRFSLRFTNQTLSHSDFENNTAQVYFNSTESVIEVINNNNIEIEDITLFSILGQRIHFWKVNTNDSSIKASVNNLETGVYILKIKTKNGDYIDKKMILN